MKDDYVRFFVRRATRRAPIINRGRDCLRVFSLVWCYEISSTWEIWTFSFPNYCKGYYARWSVLRKLLNQFLNAGKNSNDEKPKQVLSLGAGFDTTFFQLQVSLLVTWRLQLIKFDWCLCDWLIIFCSCVVFVSVGWRDCSTPLRRVGFQGGTGISHFWNVMPVLRFRMLVIQNLPRMCPLPLCTLVMSVNF